MGRAIRVGRDTGSGLRGEAQGVVPTEDGCAAYARRRWCTAQPGSRRIVQIRWPGNNLVSRCSCNDYVLSQRRDNPHPEIRQTNRAADGTVLRTGMRAKWGV